MNEDLTLHDIDFERSEHVGSSHGHGDVIQWTWKRVESDFCVLVGTNSLLTLTVVSADSTRLASTAVVSVVLVYRALYTSHDTRPLRTGSLKR